MIPLLLLLIFSPKLAWSCACGCGLFDVGTSSLFSSDSGGIVYLENDFLDQNQNRSGSSTAPAADNPDQEIRTDFVTVGAKYMLDRAWGAQLEVPYWSRYFRTTADDGGAVATTHSAVGDIRLRALYTGASADMSSGLSFGLKLPTGDWQAPGFDRDTEIGSGSTDLLLGAYHLGWLTPDRFWTWFAQITLDQPVLTQGGYFPGNELDTAFGIHYDGWRLATESRLSPLLQAIASIRSVDTGPAADSADTGYQRLLIAPSLEANIGQTRIYAEIGYAFFTHANGDQLFGSTIYKILTGFSF